MPPRTVGPYELLAVVGRGGLGVVYRARDSRTGEPAAVKLLGPSCDREAARRLTREFETLRRLAHPNIVHVHAVGSCEGYAYLAMELVEGLDLRRYLSPDLDRTRLAGSLDDSQPSGGRALRVFDLDALAAEPDTDALPRVIAARKRTAPLPRGASSAEPAGSAPRCANESAAPPPGPPSPEALAALNEPRRLRRLRDVLSQVCDALAYVHGRGLVHRDLKPSNIMVDDQRRVRIMDFGLVKSLSDARAVTLPGRVVGTFRYMSPEQADGRHVDARSDLYSLGVILYELLTGRPPSEAWSRSRPSEEVVEHGPVGVAALNPGVDPHLARIAERLVRSDPDARFQSAEALLAALELAGRQTGR